MSADDDTVERGEAMDRALDARERLEEQIAELGESIDRLKAELSAARATIAWFRSSPPRRYMATVVFLGIGPVSLDAPPGCLPEPEGWQSVLDSGRSPCLIVIWQKDDSPDMGRSTSDVAEVIQKEGS